MAFPVFCVPLYLLSRPGHFGVNGCSDECAPFYKDPYSWRGLGEGRMGTVLYVQRTLTHRAANH